jgi:uncharacterized protein YebE (UPF0316 family)
MSGLLLYVVIFFVKVFEVSLQTLRIVLITKDERVKGAFIGFFEVIIWVIVVSAVLNNITEDPFKIIVYALGFAVGNYVGSKLENLFAIGDASIEVITHKKDGQKIAQYIRKRGYAVTAVNAHGMNDDREILFMHVPRKKIKTTVRLVQEIESDVVITVHDIKPIYGGYGVLRK